MAAVFPQASVSVPETEENRTLRHLPIPAVSADGQKPVQRVSWSQDSTVHALCTSLVLALGLGSRHIQRQQPLQNLLIGHSLW